MPCKRKKCVIKNLEIFLTIYTDTLLCRMADVQCQYNYSIKASITLDPQGHNQGRLLDVCHRIIIRMDIAIYKGTVP